MALTFRDADDRQRRHRPAGAVEFRTLVDAAPTDSGDVDRNEDRDQHKGRQPAPVRRESRLKRHESEETQVDVGLGGLPESDGRRDALSHDFPLFDCACCAFTGHFLTPPLRL